MRFNRISRTKLVKNTSETIRQANESPVVITQRGHDSHVLMTMKEFQNISKSGIKYAACNNIKINICWG